MISTSVRVEHSQQTALAWALFAVSGVAAAVSVVWLVLEPSMLIVIVPFGSVLILLAGLGAIVAIWGGSPHLAGPLAVLLYIVIDITIRRQSALGTELIDLQTLAKAALYGFVFLFGVRHGLPLVRRHPLIMVFFLYAAFATVSSTYSPTLALGLVGGITLLGIVFLSAIAANFSEERIATLWTWLFWSIASLAAVSLLLYVILPGLAVATAVAGEGRLRGLTGAPNSLGPITATGILVGTHLFFVERSRWMRVGLMAALLVLTIALFLTSSRAAELAMVAAIIFVVVARSAFLATVSVALMGLFAFIVASTDIASGLGKAVTHLVSRSGSTSELTSFTGRTDIWAFVAHKWLESPWVGFGLGSPREVIATGFATRWGQTFGSAHNFMLESLLSFGLIGTILLVIPIVGVSAGLLRGMSFVERSGHDRVLRSMLLALMVFVVINGAFEKSFAGLASPSTVLLGLVLSSYYSLSHGIGKGSLATQSSPAPQEASR